MKFGQSVCLHKSLYIFENGSFRARSRSLGQIIEGPMFGTKGLWFKSPLFNAIPHNPESLGERLQGNHGPLVYRYFHYGQV